MNDAAKVVRYAFDTTIDYVGGTEYHQMVEDNSGPFVTHADYQALEKQRDSFKSLWEQAEDSLLTTLEELASIKALARGIG